MHVEFGADIDEPEMATDLAGWAKETLKVWQSALGAFLAESVVLGNEIVSAKARVPEEAVATVAMAAMAAMGKLEAEADGLDVAMVQDVGKVCGDQASTKSRPLHQSLRQTASRRNCTPA